MGSSFASVHVTDFPSGRAAWRWRRELRRAWAAAPGLRWIKAMTPVGGVSSGGFSGEPPRLRRQITIASWRSRADLEAFLAESSLARAWAVDCEYAWHVLLVPYKARGSFRGSLQFEPAPVGPDGAVAVLTLGRSRWRRLPRFAYEGVGLADGILSAPGLITAFTAGFPPTGNCTFSIWEQEQAMIDFAYGNAARHRKTIEVDKRLRVLEEQIGVRFAVAEIRGDWEPETTLRNVELRRLADRLPQGGAAIAG
jgi:hypothetical protein